MYERSLLIIKPTRCINFSNLFLKLNSTCFGQFLCPSTGVFHCTHGNGLCHTGLLTACERQQMLVHFLTFMFHSFTNLRFVWPCIVTNFFIINQLDALISQIYFGRKLCMFWTGPLFIIRSFFYCTHSNGICHTGLLRACKRDQDDPARKLSANLCDINHCRVYSEKLLLMDRGTARNM